MAWNLQQEFVRVRGKKAAGGDSTKREAVLASLVCR